ncbi:MAG: hypothetical protein C4291_10770 [Candidatus Dadabacteria bacterium]
MDNESQITKAIEIAQSVKGAKRVENKLVVKGTQRD